MRLKSGTKLGPYEIEELLGAGGMGEVYRARDVRLGRRVALKILPPELSLDPERKGRFEREARTISSLSHPHICHLYDVGCQDGTDYLVMECLEGETLAQRIARGPLPLEFALKMGVEMADALDKAHQCGVIHRDLKPGNIMLTKTGAKLLDFGLAKATAVRGKDLPSASTLTSAKSLTEEGIILGTVAYMAPEQIEGREATTTSDIFALGAILYEAITGKPPFSGASRASVMAAVLNFEPQPLTLHYPEVPKAVGQLVSTALAKTPESRWRSAHDLKLQLQNVQAQHEVAGPAHPRTAPAIWRWAPWLIALGLAVACTVIALRGLKPGAQFRPIIRSSILPPPKSSFVAHNFAISPDGRHLAFVALEEDGHTNLWVRSLDSARPQPLSGTEGATYPFWSADSRSVGFFADGKLKTIELGGGSLRVICDAPAGRGGTWNRDGVIVFAPAVVGPLKSIPALGGSPVPVTKIARAGSGQAHRWPWFLPDGRHFLLLVDWSGPADQQQDGIYVGSLDSPEIKPISNDITGTAEYSSGRMIFVQDRSLMQQPFDVARLQLSGTATPLVEEELEKDLAFSDSNFSVSADGPIAFYSAAEAASQLLWLDRAGREIGRIPGSGFMVPRLSPDGNSLAISYDPMKNGRYFIYVYDLSRELMTRLTNNGFEQYSEWSRDSRNIAYVANNGKDYRMYEIPADGSGTPKLLLQGAKMIPNDWSPDGNHLMYMDFEKGLPQLALYSLADGTRRELFQGAEGQFSPDGRWIAHVEAGLYTEVWIQAFPTGPHLQISSGGGAQARWSNDGSELFYVSGDRKLRAVPFDPKTKQPGLPKTLFQTRVISPYFALRQYDVTADRQRFVVNSLPPAGTVPLSLLTDWTAQSDK